MSNTQEITGCTEEEKQHIVTQMVSKEDLYYALKNQEEQYSLWPAYKATPHGWRVEFGPVTRGECLDYIGKTWTDMRPLSLRRQMAELQRKKIIEADDK